MAEIAKIKGYDIRDKKLADSTSQSTIASTDSIRMVTTSGSEVYITRDSFAKAIGDVFASNTQTSFSKILGMSTGNTPAPMGIEKGNLAAYIGSCQVFVENGGYAYFKIGVANGSSMFISIDASGAKSLLYFVSTIKGDTILGYSVKLLNTSDGRTNEFYHKDGYLYVYQNWGFIHLKVINMFPDEVNITTVDSLPSGATSITLE